MTADAKRLLGRGRFELRPLWPRKGHSPTCFTSNLETLETKEVEVGLFILKQFRLCLDCGESMV